MNELLNLAIDAHGGAARWREVQSISVHMNLTGLLYTVKGFPEGVTNVVVKADAHPLFGSCSDDDEQRPSA